VCLLPHTGVGEDGGPFDVLLVNEKGHITECSIANIAFEVKCEEGNDQDPLSTWWITPPESDGLLPGVLRQELLTRGHLSEQTVTVNHLRGLLKVILQGKWVDCL